MGRRSMNEKYWELGYDEVVTGIWWPFVGVADILTPRVSKIFPAWGAVLLSERGSRWVFETGYITDLGIILAVNPEGLPSLLLIFTV